MILVTGATGLVGSHLLLALLENQPTVRAIYRNEAAKQKTLALFQLYKKQAAFDRIHWIQADITDVTSLEAAFKNIDQVYHCAALISFDPNDEDALRKTNIEGTANIINFCIAHQIIKLCYLSSIGALGDLKEHETIITEDTEWNPELPHSDYAISKYGAEMEVWRGKEEGLDVIIVNPGVIIGPGFWNSGSGQLFAQVSKGIVFYTRGTTGFIAVDDVVRCLIYCMDSTTVNERYCLVAENHSFEFILNEIATAMKVKPPKWYASPAITAIAWRIDFAVSFLFRKKRKLSKLLARSLHQNNQYDNEKIKSIYSGSFQSIAESIVSTSNWYSRD